MVRQALSTIEDAAIRDLFRVEYHPGGASSILTARVPVLMEGAGHVLVLLDGDQKRGDGIINPDEIPAAQDGTLENVILEQVGVRPEFSVDGGVGGGNQKQKIIAQRKYLAWVHKNLAYIPTSSPEELVLRAAGVIEENELNNSQACKDRLKRLASENLGSEASSEHTDFYGNFLLGANRAASGELVTLAGQLTAYLNTVKPA